MNFSEMMGALVTVGPSSPQRPQRPSTAEVHRRRVQPRPGSLNNYHGEFAADVDQADQHLTAAQELINKALTHAL